jgi:diguanylate cyclase (GGDEF)-like protein/PAS domain S-box-containing protein
LTPAPRRFARYDENVNPFTPQALMHTDIAIERIIRPHILTCPPDTPLSQAAQRMVAAGCSSILVAQDDTILGIWTEQDALSLDLSSPQAFHVPIAQHMSAPVKTILISTRLGEAALRFREEKVRHFLVVDETGQRKGIITQTDIIINQGVEYYLSLRQVKSVLSRRYPVIPVTTSLTDAVRKMQAGRLDAILAQYPEGDYGILTERDVVRLVGNAQAQTSIGAVASRPLICVTVDDSLHQARKLFMEKHIRHLGVTDGSGKLLGLVTFAGLLESIEHDYVHQLRETLKEREHSLALSHQYQRLATQVFQSTLEGIMVTNTRNVIESVNPAFTQITGYLAHEAIGKTPALISSGKHDAAFYKKMHEEISSKGHWQGEIWNRRRNGEIYPEWLTINAVRDDAGQVVNYVGVFSDITKRKAAEEQMLFLAHHDGLTSLPNRGLFVERLSHAIARAHRTQDKMALMFLDIDHFKQINDTLGHHVGDQLLQLVARRLTACVREGDTVARLGGDEFTVILESITQPGDVPPIAQKIIAALAQPMLLDGQELVVTASIGISLYPHDSEEPDELIKCADAAMYAAKKEGRNRVRFFTAAMKDAGA